MDNETSLFVLNFISDCYASQELEHFLKTAYKYFGNPCALYDVSLNTISYIGDVSVEDSYWHETIYDGHLSKETIDSFVKEGWMNHKFDILYQMFSPGVFGPSLPSENMRRLGIAIPSKDGTQIGWFAVFEHDRPFEKRDSELMIWSAKIISPHIEGLLYKKTSSLGRTENIIIDLLNDSIQISEAQHRLEISGWSMLRYNRILVIQSEDHYLPKTMREFVKQSFFKFTSNVSSFMYNGSFVVFLSSGDDIFDDVFFKETGYNLEQLHLRGGFSRSFHNISELRRQYIQALECIRICTIKGIGKPLVFFEDYAIDIMLLNANRFFDLKDYCHPFLFCLQEYDQRQNTPYLDTLRQFVFSNGNLKAAAQELGVHRNTLSYRIEKTQEVLGIKSFSQKLLSDLYISFVVFDTIKLESNNREREIII